MLQANVYETLPHFPVAAGVFIGISGWSIRASLLLKSDGQKPVTVLLQLLAYVSAATEV